MEPPTWSEILTLIAVIQTSIMLRRTPRKEGKHRKRKRYRRGERK